MSAIRSTVLTLIVTSAVSLSLLHGCSGDPALDATGKKTYKIALDQAPVTLDPVKAATIYTNHVVVNAYDTLYRYKYLARPYELAPRLAEGMPTVSDDGLTYTFKLKQGVRFIDNESFAEGKGREVVAEDFVYSMKRHFDPKTLSEGAWFWQGRIVGLDDWGKNGADYDAPVEGLKATDRYTVQVVLTKPYPQLVHTFAQGFAAVVPREAVEFYGREIAINPVGSGPFIVKRFDTTRAVMERNPNYRQEPISLEYEGFDPSSQGGLGLESIEGKSPPLVDRVELMFIAEDSARITSLTKGDELHTARIPTAQFDVFLKNKDPIELTEKHAETFHILAGVEAGFVYHAFNLLDENFGYNDDPVREQRNKALRCAVIKGFNWSERNNRFYSGLGKVFPGIITPQMPEFDPNLSTESVTHDVDGAKALLAEAGWNADNLPELVYGMTATVLESQYFEQFRGFMSDIGYPSEKVVSKQYATFGDINKAWKQARLPLVNLGWNLDYPDAENTMQLFYGPNGSPGSNNSNYSNPEYDRLYRETAVMQAGPERTKLYRQMNEMLINDCVAMTGISRTMVFLWNKKIVAYPDRSFVGGFYFPYVDVPAPQIQ